jgi:hypothetical protein
MSPQAAEIKTRVGNALEQHLSPSIRSSDGTKNILEKPALNSEFMCLAADKDVVEKALEIINFFRQ